MHWGPLSLSRHTPRSVRTPANPHCKICRAYRVFVLLALFACGCLFATAPATAGESVLRVLAWPGYADPDVVKAFEARFHAKVEVTLVDSDEALWDNMHAGRMPQFDVLAANTAEIQRYTQEHMLAPLDLAQIPNTRRQ